MMLDEKWLPRFPHFEATPADFLSWEQSRVFDQVAALVGVAFNLTGDDRPECIRAETGNIHLQTNCPIDKPASVL